MDRVIPFFEGKEEIVGTTDMDAADIFHILMNDLIENTDNLPLSKEEKQSVEDRAVEQLESLGEQYADYMDSVAVLYDINNWLNKNGYEWKLMPTAGTGRIREALGITDNKPVDMRGICITNKFHLWVGKKTFDKLRELLPEHWCTEVYGWEYKENILQHPKCREIRLGTIEIWDNLETGKYTSDYHG